MFLIFVFVNLAILFNFCFIHRSAKLECAMAQRPHSISVNIILLFLIVIFQMFIYFQIENDSIQSWNHKYFIVFCFVLFLSLKLK